MVENRYSRWTVEGDKKTKWICGCFQTSDDYFKFCKKHNDILKKAIQTQIDELDLTLVIEDQIASIAINADTNTIAMVFSNLITVFNAGPAVSL